MKNLLSEKPQKKREENYQKGKPTIQFQFKKLAFFVLFCNRKPMAFRSGKVKLFYFSFLFASLSFLSWINRFWALTNDFYNNEHMEWQRFFGNGTYQLFLIVAKINYHFFFFFISSTNVIRCIHLPTLPWIGGHFYRPIIIIKNIIIKSLHNRFFIWHCLRHENLPLLIRTRTEKQKTKHKFTTNRKIEGNEEEEKIK